MKVLLSTPGPWELEYGGGQVYVRSLALELIRLGHQVEGLSLVLDLNGNGPPRLRQTETHGPVKVHTLTGPTPLRGSSWSQCVDQILASSRPSIVHANAAKGLLAKACHRQHIPCVVTMHHAGLVCPAGALLDAEATICRRPISESQCVSCHRKQLPGGSTVSPLLALVSVRVQQKLACRLRRLGWLPFLSPALEALEETRAKQDEIQELVRCRPRVICPSAAAQRALCLNGFPEELTRVVPHGIQPLPRRPFGPGLPERPVRFGYFGRIQRAKGVHLLTRAVDLLAQPCELHLAGFLHTRWERRYWSKALASIRKPERLRLHSFLRGESFANGLADCDVIVVPSICMEVFGLVVLEAFSVGRPVIVTDSGGPGELTRHGVDGFVVPPGDAEALARAMARFVDDPMLAVRMAAQPPAVKTIAEYAREIELLYHAQTQESKSLPKAVSPP